jgi:WD40 repeat protein
MATVSPSYSNKVVGTLRVPSDNGERVAHVSEFELVKRREMRLYKLKKCKRIHGLYFSPDSLQLMVAHGIEASGADGAVWLDLAEGIPAYTLPFFTGIYGGEAYAISADHSHLVISNRVDQPINLQNLIHFCNPRQLPSLWRARALGLTWPEEMDSIYPYKLALSPDGNRLLIAYGWQRISQVGGEWTYHLMECLGEKNNPTIIDVDSQIGTMAFTPDGTRFAISQGEDRRNRIGVYNQFGGSPLIEVEVPGLRIGSPTFSPDGKFFAAINSAKTVIVMTADRLTAIGILETNSKKQVGGLAFSPDGCRLITGAGDGTIRVWDIARAAIIESFDWKIGPLTAVAFSPDGSLCAAGGKNGQIVVWDVD